MRATNIEVADKLFGLTGQIHGRGLHEKGIGPLGQPDVRGQHGIRAGAQGGPVLGPVIINLKNAVRTTKGTKPTNIQMFMLTQRLTTLVKAQSANILLESIDFVLFVLFVVVFNCRI